MLQGSTPLHYAGFKDAIVLTLDMIGCLGQDTDISDEDSEICKVNPVINTLILMVFVMHLKLS